MGHRIRCRRPQSAVEALRLTTIPVPLPIVTQGIRVVRHISTTTNQTVRLTTFPKPQLQNRLVSGQCNTKTINKTPKSSIKKDIKKTVPNKRSSQTQCESSQSKQILSNMQQSSYSHMLPIESYYHAGAYMQHYGQQVPMPMYFNNNNCMNYMMAQHSSYQPPFMGNTMLYTMPNTVPNMLRKNIRAISPRNITPIQSGIKFPQPLTMWNNEIGRPIAGGTGQFLSRIHSCTNMKDGVQDSKLELLEYRKNHKELVPPSKPNRPKAGDSTTTLTPFSFVSRTVKPQKKPFKERFKTSVLKHTARLKRGMKILIGQTKQNVGASSSNYNNYQIVPYTKKKGKSKVCGQSSISHCWTRSYPTAKLTTSNDVEIKRRYNENFDKETLQNYRRYRTETQRNEDTYGKHRRNLKVKIKYDQRKIRKPKGLYPTCSLNDNW